jgi:hypothetical protein
MQTLTPRSFVLLSALAVSAIGFASVAQAQMAGPSDPSTMMGRAVSRAPDMSKPDAVPPPALPGAASRADSVVPSTKNPTDMSPNDALFDAINRGDIAGARDALSRGAELEAHNVLGMTPMELSVDLGRNNISFLLLSLRGTGSSSSGPPAQTAEKATKSTRGRKAAAAAAEKAEVQASREAAAGNLSVQATAPRTARQFANDGGAPNPNAGFLGFDSTRSGSSTR